MRYALLIYSSLAAAEERRGQGRWPIEPSIAAILERPNVVGWVRLHHAESATTLSLEDSRKLLIDGPFVDSKEYLAGLITIEVDDLDQALAFADELQATRSSGAIEVRPALD
jgi:hypothetical protein